MKNKHMWFGLLCGSAISALVNFSLIMFIFHEWVVFYFPAPFCILIALAFLKSDDWKKFAIAILFVLVGLKVKRLKNLANKPYSVSTLDERILHEIKDVFIYTRHHAFSKDKLLIADNLMQIEEKCGLIDQSGTAFQKSIFNYCLYNLKQLFEKQQYEILYDFADAIHNLPDIFCYEYNLKHYWKQYVKPLRKKHGNHFFCNYQQVFKGMNTSLISAKQ